MRGWPITYEDFSGGLNTQSAPYLLQGNQARDCLNVHTSLIGDIEKRYGFVTLSGSSLTGSPVDATLAHSLFPVNVSTKSLIGAAETATTDTIFKMTTGGVATTLKTGLTAKTPWHFAQCEIFSEKGPIFGLNGVDTPIVWNGTSGSLEEWKASSGEVPKTAKFLTYFTSRLWCAAGARLYYSGITGSDPDPFNWESENYVDLEPGDGQPITGIGYIGAYLIVFKARKTYCIYEPTTGANRLISGNLGCVSHRSIVNTPAGIFFLSEDQGLCKTDGKSCAPFSDVILPTLNKVALSPTTQALAAGTLQGRRYYLSVSLNGERNDHTLEFDLVTGSFWLHDCASNQFALLNPASGPVLYSADSTESARISKAFVEGVFTDNGENYKGNSYFVSPDFAWGFSGSLRYQKYVDPHRIKRVRELRIDGVGNWETFGVENFGTEWELLDGETWVPESPGEGASGFFEGEGQGDFEGEGGGEFEESSETVIDRHYHTPSLGRSVSYRYENSDGNNFKIYSTTIAFQMRED